MTTPTCNPIARIDALFERLTKARQLVANGKVHPVYGMADHFIVEGADDKYVVNGACVCPDATHRYELNKGLCKHRLAALVYAQAHTEANPDGSSPKDEELEAKVNDLFR